MLDRINIVTSTETIIKINILKDIDTINGMTTGSSIRGI